MGVILRVYQRKDLPEMLQLFYDTIHTVNRRDYSEEQCRAWADGKADVSLWDASLSAHETIVACKEGKIVGFADMDSTGYLDRLYVHKDYQGCHIAAALCDRLEQIVSCQRYTTHASLTAVGFFKKRGYRIVKKQEVVRHDVSLVNYVMEKKAEGNGALKG